jgi:transposase InsO family protein
VSAFIEQHRARFGVEPICRTLGVSESAYYTRAGGRRSRRAVEDEQLVEAIRELHARNWYAYGYRRVWLALCREGWQVGRDRVRRLMREHGIEGAKRRSKRWRTTRPNLAAARPSDLVERNFAADRPDALWVADLTYLRSWQGVAYLAFVLDAYSRRIVGWQLATTMRTSLVLDALRMALSRRQAGATVELVHHSDAGSQYTSREFQQVLDDHQVLASIGSVGDAYDNALAESFVDTLKTELVADRIFTSRRALELAVVAWIGWYNETRLHSSIGDQSPAEHEHRYYALRQPAA